VIAAINGACAGLGFSYATFCDMRFMDRTAKLVTSFSPRGLIAEHGTSWILPKIIGPSHALDLMWTSRRVDAEEAYRIGYANRLSENAEALKEAQDFIFNLAKTSAPYSLMMMKKQIYQHLNQDLGLSNTESTKWMDESLERDDFKEGIKSFLEKRSPNFKRIK
jgi:enoyl-CoA hydratase/carnithine racemase